jgi:protein tyrosine/serine phosphatase
MEFRNSIRQAAKKKTLYTNHALDEMNSEEKVITTEEIRCVILNGEMIEDYLDDKRGHSCLLFGISKEDRPVHVVCAPKKDYLAIITAYIPSIEKWEIGFKRRRPK